MTYLQRKKLAFMSILNRIKGFVRSVSGVPPLTLPDCVDEDSLINYTISGNSVQNGTPAPDAPVQVESVGEKTVNLFDYNNYFNRLGSVDIDKNIFGVALALKPNTQYTISTNIPYYNGYVNLFASNTIAGNNITTTNNGVALGNSRSITTDGTGTFYVISRKPDSGYGFSLVLEDFQSGKYWIQIEEGATATDFEPYGYKVPVVCSGKNIVGEYNYIDQTTRYGSPLHAKKAFTLKQGVTYTISFDTPNTGKNVAYAQYAITEEGLKTVSLNGTRRSLTVTPTRDITSATILTVTSVVSEGDSTGLCSNCMIEIGSAVTDYEPYVKPITTNIYLDEPLRKIGDYADYVDFENQKVVRKVSETILNGTGGGTFLAGGTTYERIYYTHSAFGSLAGESLCNAIKTTNSPNSGWNGTGFIIQASSNGIFIYRPAYSGVLPDITSLKAWNDFLAERYQNGNPIKLYYILAEAIEKIISIPKPPTIKGKTIYSIGTDVQPSDMSVTYYATSKE